MSLVRFGVLGAAAVVPYALLGPSRVVGGASIEAIAARDPLRAAAFARTHQIPRVYDTYEQVIHDPALDAIYNPLPNSLHYKWTLAALRAGKHVLCEKPFASNAREAEEMARAADESGRVLMEAFHFRYHPLMLRMLEVLASGELGPLRSVEAYMCFPLRRVNDIRWSYALAGGATMDAGCYCIQLIRVFGGEPTVTRARARALFPKVDRRMEAEFRFEDGQEARMVCSMLGLPLVRFEAIVRGERGEMRAPYPFIPSRAGRLSVKTTKGERIERITREPSYNFQLRAFLGALRGEPTNLTDGHDAVKNMRVIDSVYARAGLPLRGT
jgi:predicted dehydrogenase